MNVDSAVGYFTAISVLFRSIGWYLEESTNSFLGFAVHSRVAKYHVEKANLTTICPHSLLEVP
jgi:hypothetical protein